MLQWSKAVSRRKLCVEYGLKVLHDTMLSSTVYEITGDSVLQAVSQSDRQIDRQSDSQLGRQSDRQADIQMFRQTVS